MAEINQKSVLNLAAIDIGSNAARILIKRVEKSEHGIYSKKLQFLRIPLRLGLDVFTEGRIGKDREKMLVRTMQVFRQLMTLYNVNNHLIYATSAFRDAKNGASIIREIKKETKLEINIISGEEEARIIHDNFHADGNLLYMDVGGGSTELSLVCDGKLIDNRSINIGTIRLLKKTVASRDWEQLIEQVKQMTAGIDNIRIVGSGGNINKLVRLAYKNEKRTQLAVNELINLYRKMAPMTVEERMVKYDLGESRADVIVPAAQIFIMVACLVRAQEITVPNVGLVDGMINRLTSTLFSE